MVSHAQTIASLVQTMVPLVETTASEVRILGSLGRTISRGRTILYINDSKLRVGLAPIEAEILFPAFFGRENIAAESGK